MAWLLALTLAMAPAPARTSDVAAARALFEKNLDAIRRRDKAAYLACYLDSDKLAKTSADGMSLGYADFAKAAGENWRTRSTRATSSSCPCGRAWSTGHTGTASATDRMSRPAFRNASS